MRVVAGELKGRRLASPPRGSAAVRPTADRVREALFSILGDVGGRGTRPLLRHRGARDRGPLARGRAAPRWSTSRTSLARRNVAELGSGGPLRGRARRRDRATCGAPRRRFDLIFCDPPYRLADRLEGELDSLIPARLAEGGRLITESATRRPLELGLPLLTERRYGDTTDPDPRGTGDR